MFLTTLLLLLPALVASLLPPPGSVNTTIAYSGNGCPKESVLANLSADGSNLTMAFSDAASATIGPGLPKGNNTKNCVVHFTIRTPSHWFFAIEEVFHNGYATLDPGVSAMIHSTHVFSAIDTAYEVWDTRRQGGSEGWATGQTVSEHYNVSDKAMVWGGGGGTIVFGYYLRFALSSSSPNATGSMSISKDAGGNQMLQVLKLKWRESPYRG